jgi:hypothetical protein
MLILLTNWTGAKNIFTDRFGVLLGLLSGLVSGAILAYATRFSLRLAWKERSRADGQ